MNQKITIIALIVLVILLAGATTYFAIAKSKMQKEASALTENNRKLEKEATELKLANEKLEKEITEIKTSLMQYSVAPEQLAEARKKANIASIKAYISSAMSQTILCWDANNNILSGNGGSKVCAKESYTWPVISSCGPNPSDSKWVVKSGDTDNWDFVLDCKEFTDCNGPQNVICNKDGCKFAGSCQ